MPFSACCSHLAGVATPGVVSMPSASTSGSLAEAGKEAPVAAGEGSPPQEPTGNAAQERTSGHSTPSKRSLEGSPDTSPPKLQKGRCTLVLQQYVIFGANSHTPIQNGLPAACG